jgi:hypothetical protein
MYKHVETVAVVETIVMPQIVEQIVGFNNVTDIRTKAS